MLASQAEDLGAGARTFSSSQMDHSTGRRMVGQMLGSRESGMGLEQLWGSRQSRLGATKSMHVRGASCSREAPLVNLRHLPQPLAIRRRRAVSAMWMPADAGEWRCCTMECGARCVTMTGATVTRKWCAGNWGWVGALREARHTGDRDRDESGWMMLVAAGASSSLRSALSGAGGITTADTLRTRVCAAVVKRRA